MHNHVEEISSLRSPHQWLKNQKLQLTSSMAQRKGVTTTIVNKNKNYINNWRLLAELAGRHHEAIIKE